jgi:hypothetical protein
MHREYKIHRNDLLTEQDIQRTIAKYEETYQMTSAEFIAAWNRYQFPESFDFLDWHQLLRCREALQES